MKRLLTAALLCVTLGSATYFGFVHTRADSDLQSLEDDRETGDDPDRVPTRDLVARRGERDASRTRGVDDRSTRPSGELWLEIRTRGSVPAAAIPVRLWPSASENRPPLLIYRSDEHGRIRVPEMQELARKHGPAWTAAVDLPLRTPVVARFRADALPELVVLTLPDLGSIEFSLITATGSPVRVPGTVRLELAGTDGRKQTPVHRSILMFAELRGGVARFDHVGLGTAFRVSVRHGKRANILSTAAQERTYAGPRGADEVRRHKLVLDESSIVIAGRALRPGGEQRPVRAGYLGMHAHGPEVSAKYGSRVQEDGSFTFFMKYGSSGLHHLSFESRTKTEHLVARARATVTGPGARVDVGTLVFTEPRVLVAGRVENSKGKPLRSAIVELRRRLHGRYRVVATSSKVSDTFAFVGGETSGAFRLWARAPGYVTTTREIELGATDVVLRMDTYAIVRLQAKIDRQLVKPGLVEKLRLRLRTPRGWERTVEARPGTDGTVRFYVPTLRPAKYSLSLALPNWPKPIWTQEAREVRSGPNDMGTVDLASRLYSFEFRAEFPTGATPPTMRYLSLRHRESATSASWQTYRFHKPVFVVAPTASLDYSAFASGYGKRAGHALVGRNIIRFEPEKK